MNLAPRQRALCGLVLALLLAPLNSTGATISVEEAAGVLSVRLSGQIRDGDAQSFVRLLTSLKKTPQRLLLNSPGGSVNEAVRLASIVEKSALETGVDGICASACFFVWLAGSYRQALSGEYISAPQIRDGLRNKGLITGYIGLHRPFSPSLQSPINEQSALMRTVTAYLDLKLVPRRLVDAMMTRPSNDIYWLTNDDLEDLGNYSPPLEEYLIQKCAYDRNYVTKWRLAFDSGRHEEATRVESTRKQSAACERAELSALRDRGVLSIRKGWRPN